MNKHLKELLFRPHEHIAGFKALWIGVLAILLTGIINIFSLTHLDGIIDVHFGEKAIPNLLFIIEGFANWLIFSIVLFISGIIFSKSSIRIIDVLGTQAMARWPMLIMAVSAISIPHAEIVQYFSHKYLHPGEAPLPLTYLQIILFIISMLIIVVTIIWMVMLMYRAFSISCNIKGSKAIAIFIGGMIVAETLAKFFLLFINNYLGVI